MQSSKHIFIDQHKMAVAYLYKIKADVFKFLQKIKEEPSIFPAPSTIVMKMEYLGYTDFRNVDVPEKTQKDAKKTFATLAGWSDCEDENRDANLPKESETATDNNATSIKEKEDEVKVTQNEPSDAKESDEKK
eukprot:TRINITY_DN3570_c0_g1_i1.p2 TRINITY_DN3570_c0_g1~~TRINITY_DN3570_c0_g1_i1.p2  ORF type:complete len:133 (-),score=35.42 TRINITY_DN3570_c0_g1_i1:823-1221(-)